MLPGRSAADPGGRRRWAAAAVVVSVAVLVLAGVLRAALDTGDAPTSTTVHHPAPSAENEVLSAATAAMSAWGDFAGTGDLARLDGHFDESGPQYRQLAGEARSMAAAGVTSAYEVDCRCVVETLSGDRATVRATVAWRRGAEPEQRWEWIIDLRRSEAKWTVWTVRAT